MLIETRETPNPNTLQFFPGRPVAGDLALQLHLSFVKGDSCEASPLAKRLLAVVGISAVYLANDFLSVSKNQELDWYILKPVILGILMEHYVNHYPIVLDPAGLALVREDSVPDKLDSDGAMAQGGVDEDDEIVKQIREIIQTRVRPTVAQDGGDISFDSFVDGVVYLKMHGACSGCPSSTVTLKSGIENMLKYYVPEVREVREVEH